MNSSGRAIYGALPPNYRLSDSEPYGIRDTGWRMAIFQRSDISDRRPNFPCVIGEEGDWWITFSRRIPSVDDRFRLRSGRAGILKKQGYNKHGMDQDDC